MKNKINVKANQQGFTLIELVVVIVILGILAVTAAPKFINLQSDARTATLQAVKASMETASTLVYAKSLLAGNETTDAGGAADNPTVVVNSAKAVVNLKFGYPISTAGTDPVTAPNTDWALLLDVNANDFIISSTAIAGYVVVYPADKRAPTAIPSDLEAPAAPTNAVSEDCFAYYDETEAAGTKPVMAVSVCL
jgi:MSHA pilin protein MshA